MPMYDSCHKNCSQTTTHSVCAMSAALKATVMQRMLTKVEQLRTGKQSQRILSEYAGVEAKLQQVVEP